MKIFLFVFRMQTWTLTKWILSLKGPPRRACHKELVKSYVHILLLESDMDVFEEVLEPLVQISILIPTPYVSLDGPKSLVQKFPKGIWIMSKYTSYFNFHFFYLEFCNFHFIMLSSYFLVELSFHLRPWICLHSW